jgi:hypothetical protein
MPALPDRYGTPRTRNLPNLRHQDKDSHMTTTRTGYVCRDHHGQPVNHRGKGCTLCPPLHTKKSKRRKTPEITDEWWTQ